MRFWSGFRRRLLSEYNVVLVAGLRARPSYEQKVRELLLRMRAPTRAERGCIAYELHQSKVDGSLFFVYEVWQDEVALDAHLRSAHTRNFKTVAPDMLEGPVLLNKWGVVL